MSVTFKALSPTACKVLVDEKPVADYYKRTGVVCFLRPVAEKTKDDIKKAIESSKWKHVKDVPPPPDIPEDMKE